MSVEVVAYQDDFLRAGIVNIEKFLDFLCPIEFGFSFTNIDLAPSRQRLSEQEVVGGTISLIFKIDSLGDSRLGRDWDPGFFDELDGLFVHADNRHIGVVATLVNIQYVFHVHDEVGISLRWNYPTLAQVRLEVVFFSVRRTVWSEIESTIFNTTNSVARSSNVQRDRPLGGSLQAN